MNPLKLQRTYIIALGLIALLVILAEVVVLYNVQGTVDDSRIINISGRQRMLSQKITKVSFLMLNSETPEKYNDAQNELKEALTIWEKSHNGLQKGDADLLIAASPNISDENKANYQKIEPYYQNMLTAGKSLLEMQYSSNDSIQRATHLPNVSIIRDNEADFLKLMNAITFQYDADAKGRIDTLRWSALGVGIAILLIIAYLAIFFFRPIVAQFIKNVKAINEANEKLASSEEEIRKSMEKQLEVNENMFLLQQDMERKNKSLKESEAELMKATENQLKANEEPYLSKKEIEDKSAKMQETLSELRTLQNQIIIAQELEKMAGGTSKMMKNVAKQEQVKFDASYVDDLIEKGLPVPEKEVERLKALYSYDILDTLPEEEFDQITKLAAFICGTPISIISLIDKDRQWFKSEVGLGAKQTDREVAFCQYAIMDTKVFEVNNALEDERFKNNPLVTGNPDIRFYAGAPLQTEDGHNIGTLCVIDNKPSQLTETQRQNLTYLAEMVMARLESIRQKKLLLAVNQQVQGAFQTLKSTEARLSALINNTEAAIFSIDNNWHVTVANDAWLKSYKQKGIEVNLGETDIRTLLSPEQLEKQQELFNKALRGNRFTVVESAENDEWDEIWTETAYNPIRDNDGLVIGVSVFADDITTQKKDEMEREKLTFKARLHNDVIGELTRYNFVNVKDMEEAYQLVTEQACVGMEVDRCSIWLLNEDKNELLCKDLFDLSKGEHSKIDNLIQSTYPKYFNETLSGEVLAIKNVHTNEATVEIGKSYFDKLNINTLINAPIRVNGVVVGMISCVGKGKPREWTLEEINFMQTIANFITLALEALERKKVQLQLQQAFEDQRIINESMIVAQRELARKNEAVKASEEELRKIVEEQLEMNEKLMMAENEIKSALEQEQKSKEELDDTLDKLKGAQSQLVHNEKMASLGQLTAGIAHEINNPINFVYNGIDTLKISLDELLEIVKKYEKLDDAPNKEDVINEIKQLKKQLDYEELLEDVNLLVGDIKKGAVRTMEIVKGLRVFSRLDEEEMKVASVTDCLESTLVLLNNKVKDKVEIKKYYDNTIPDILCYPGQLNQVFMNLLNNAVQAIPDGKTDGTISIYTENLQENVVIRIKDNGKGMSEQVQRRIFEPFFTTKDVGVGTGLGLSISYGIIEKHEGEIYVNSEEGKGTEFVIRLPKKS